MAIMELSDKKVDDGFLRMTTDQARAAWELLGQYSREVWFGRNGLNAVYGVAQGLLPGAALPAYVYQTLKHHGLLEADSLDGSARFAPTFVRYLDEATVRRGKGRQLRPEAAPDTLGYGPMRTLQIARPVL